MDEQLPCQKRKQSNFCVGMTFGYLVTMKVVRQLVIARGSVPPACLLDKMALTVT
jgi:hypothetical protein